MAMLQDLLDAPSLSLWRILHDYKSERFVLEVVKD